jgi:hypothetical protein
MFYNIMSNHLHLWATMFVLLLDQLFVFDVCKLCPNYSFALLVCICVINENFSSCFFFLCNG